MFPNSRNSATVGSHLRKNSSPSSDSCADAVRLDTAFRLPNSNSPLAEAVTDSSIFNDVLRLRWNQTPKCARDTHAGSRKKACLQFPPVVHQLDQVCALRVETQMHITALGGDWLERHFRTSGQETHFGIDCPRVQRSTSSTTGLESRCTMGNRLHLCCATLNAVDNDYCTPPRNTESESRFRRRNPRVQGNRMRQPRQGVTDDASTSGMRYPAGLCRDTKLFRSRCSDMDEKYGYHDRA